MHLEIINHINVYKRWMNVWLTENKTKIGKIRKTLANLKCVHKHTVTEICCWCNDFSAFTRIFCPSIFYKIELWIKGKIKWWRKIKRFHCIHSWVNFILIFGHPSIWNVSVSLCEKKINSKKHWKISKENLWKYWCIYQLFGINFWRIIL